MATFGGLQRSPLIDRGAETRSGDADGAPSMSTVDTPCLPAEIKALVAECLQKSDLKSLRSVSKPWHAMATPVLFDKVYISPRDRDLQVFSNITNHPVLSRSIKKLVCDTSRFPDLSHEDYFYELCDDFRAMTITISRECPFNSPHPRLNDFINEIRRQEAYSNLLPKFGNIGLVTEGFQFWKELAAEECQKFEGGCYGMFYLELCSGLPQLPTLKSVKMEDDISAYLNKDLIDQFGATNPTNPHHTPGPFLSRSPLARSWNPWHLRPKRSKDYGLEHFSLVIQALSRTQKRIEKFKCESLVRKGLPPAAFARNGITEQFHHHLANALWQLRRLDLKITPRSHDSVDHNNAEVIGLLPYLLEQTTGLRRLSLVLSSIEHVREVGRSSVPLLDNVYYTYSQVFSNRGTWQHLEYLFVTGLAIHALDMFFLLLNQMPQLQGLCLSHIDLLSGTWDGVVEAMRIREFIIPWSFFRLMRSFRQQGGQWWPYTPGGRQERLALKHYMRYVKEGGHHPSLPAESEDRLSLNYLHEIHQEGAPERIPALWLRTQEIKDRRM